MPLDLGTLGGPAGKAFDINDAGVVVGRSTLPGDSVLDDRAFLWSESTGMIYLGALIEHAESLAEAVNEAGTAVGYSESSLGGDRQAVLWRDSTIINLGNLQEGQSSYAYDINEKDYVIGTANIHSAKRAALWHPDGTIEDLGEFFGGGTYAYAINDRLEIAGHTTYIGGRAFYYNYITDEIINLQEDSFTITSAAYDINNMGQAVGKRTDGWTMKEEGFVWDHEHGMVVLNRLRPPNCDWRLRSARGINDFGQITGRGSRTGDGYWDGSGFLMTPVYHSFDLTYARPGKADEVNTIRAANFVNVPVGTTVYFCYSFRGGGSLIPGCDVSINALQIDNAKVAGTATVGENGVAKLVGKVPPSMHGRQVIFQAVIPGSCEISNLVVQRFE
ncbi:MAG: DUF3466 family protein [Planctomycetes bacterium]|nr:DUF3466 family protein [Planctomycetota bacterium]